MKALSILLLASVGAFGQNTPCPPHSHYGGDLNCLADDGWVLKSAKDKVWAEPTQTLTCKKYEHVVKGREAYCHGPACDGNFACTTIAICEPATQDSCAPIMHEVTEKEWVELQERLKVLDKYIKVQMCFSLEYHGVISTDGGKTTVNCADLKPKPLVCETGSNGIKLCRAGKE